MPPTATDATSWPRWLPAGLLAAFVYVGFEPFADGSSVEGGNLVNQIGFAALALVAARLIAFMPPQARRALLRPAWVAVGVVLLLAALRADDPGASLRAAIFSAIVVVVAGTIVAWPRSQGELTGTLTTAALAALAFSLVAVFAVPHVGVHGPFGPEAHHAGLWRGVYPHKNVAGYVAGAFVIVGVYVARSGRPGWGIVTATLAVIFTVQAGSKTVLAVLPVALTTAWLAARFSNPWLRALTVALPVAALATVTLGAALFPSVDATLQAMFPGTTFTGRLDLWRFTAEQIAKRPHGGYGFESFWTTQRAIGLEQPIELSWDVRKIVHGHNAFLDAVIAFGGWGAAIVLWVVLVLPVAHFARLPARGPVARLGQLYIALWLLCAMGASLESFFLRRADPVWFTMTLAVFGLQIAYHRSRVLRRPVAERFDDPVDRRVVDVEMGHQA